jgi:hypothetical protein
MEINLDELFFNSLEPAEVKRLKYLQNAKRIRKIAPRVYTSDFETPPGDLVKRNLFRILDHLYPGIIISHRSAFEVKPTGTLKLFATYKYSRKIEYPGIIIKLIKGMGPLDDDIRIGPLCASSRPRAFLENFQISTKKGDDSKILSPEAIKEKLSDELNLYGREGLKQLLEKAQILSVILNMEKEYIKLEEKAKMLLSANGEQHKE